MPTSAHHAHSVRFRLDGQDLSSYEFYNNRVVGSPAIVDLTVERDDMRNVVDVVHHFMRIIRTGAWNSAPSAESLSDGYGHETLWPMSNQIKQEIIIGDLTWTLIYNTDTKQFLLNRTAFDLKWSDFVYFLTCWHRFIYEEVP